MASSSAIGVTEPAKWRNYETWTHEEDEWLRVQVGRRSVPNLAVEMGRTHLSVYKRIYQLGLSKQNCHNRASTIYKELGGNTHGHMYASFRAHLEDDRIRHWFDGRNKKTGRLTLHPTEALWVRRGGLKNGKPDWATLNHMKEKMG